MSTQHSDITWSGISKIRRDESVVTEDDYQVGDTLKHKGETVTVAHISNYGQANETYDLARPSGEILFDIPREQIDEFSSHSGSVDPLVESVRPSSNNCGLVDRTIRLDVPLRGVETSGFINESTVISDSSRTNRFVRPLHRSVQSVIMTEAAEPTHHRTFTVGQPLAIHSSTRPAHIYMYPRSDAPGYHRVKRITTGEFADVHEDDIMPTTKSEAISPGYLIPVNSPTNGSRPDGQFDYPKTVEYPTHALALQELHARLGVAIPELHCLLTSTVTDEQNALAMLFNELNTAHADIGNVLSYSNSIPDIEMGQLYIHYLTVVNEMLAALDPYSEQNRAVSTGSYHFGGALSEAAPA